MITCLDPRTDPSAFLELQLGDAVAVRNAVLPAGITVSGHVYDVTAGLVTTVIPATPVRAGVTRDV